MTHTFEVQFRHLFNKVCGWKVIVIVVIHESSLCAIVFHLYIQSIQKEKDCKLLVPPFMDFLNEKEETFISYHGCWLQKKKRANIWWGEEQQALQKRKPAHNKPHTLVIHHLQMQNRTGTPHLSTLKHSTVRLVSMENVVFCIACAIFLYFFFAAHL